MSLIYGKFAYKLFWLIEIEVLTQSSFICHN